MIRLLFLMSNIFRLSSSNRSFPFFINSNLIHLCLKSFIWFLDLILFNASFAIFARWNMSYTISTLADARWCLQGTTAEIIDYQFDLKQTSLRAWANIRTISENWNSYHWSRILFLWYQHLRSRWMPVSAFAGCLTQFFTSEDPFVQHPLYMILWYAFQYLWLDMHELYRSCRRYSLHQRYLPLFKASVNDVFFRAHGMVICFMSHFGHYIWVYWRWRKHLISLTSESLHTLCTQSWILHLSLQTRHSLRAFDFFKRLLSLRSDVAFTFSTNQGPSKFKRVLNILFTSDPNMS